MPSGSQVCVIIVSFNSRAHFGRLSGALQAQTAQGFELVVVDNASRPDQRPKPADFPQGTTVIQLEENIGFAAANNLAAARSSAGFIALLNPDAFPDPPWLEALLRAAGRWPQAAAFGSLQLSDQDPTRLDGAGDAYHAVGAAWRGGFGHPHRPLAGDRETFSACAAAALYRAGPWRAVGGFEPSYFCFCEDVDLGFRLRLRGWVTIQVADAVVRHIGGASTGSRSRFANFHGVRNLIWTFVRNMPGPLFWPLLPAHMALIGVMILVHAVTGRGLAAGAGAGAAIRGLKPVWAMRRQIQAQRQVSAWTIARALSWSPLRLLDRKPVLRRPLDAAAAPE